MAEGQPGDIRVRKGQNLEDGNEDHKTEIPNGRSPPRERRKQPPLLPKIRGQQRRGISGRRQSREEVDVRNGSVMET